MRLLNLRRAVRSIEGAGPGPEGNITKLKLAEHMGEYAAISCALLGADIALMDGPAAIADPDGHGCTRHGDRGWHLRGDAQSDRRADPGHAARSADQVT